MERVAVTAEKRETGKGANKRMRAEGRVPAVLYGRAVEPLSISVDRRQMENAVKGKAGMNVLIDLSIAEGDSGLALIRDYQADPFKREFTHIDFQAITMKDRLDVEVPIELIGKSIGVKEGGIVEQLKRTVHVKAFPDKIPDNIQVDISELAIGDNIHANDIKLPEGVEYLYKENYAIVSIVPPAKVEEVAPVPTEGELAEGEEAALVEGEEKEGAAPSAEKKEVGKKEAGKKE